MSIRYEESTSIPGVGLGLMVGLFVPKAFGISVSSVPPHPCGLSAANPARKEECP
jgi:hypothetical protein